MQKHIKNYLSYYGIEPHEVFCEKCGMKSEDIHHIIYRSAFGKKEKDSQDSIENLIALCRTHHNQAHFKEEPFLSKEELQGIHNNNLHNEARYM